MKMTIFNLESEGVESKAWKLRCIILRKGRKLGVWNTHTHTGHRCFD